MKNLTLLFLFLYSFQLVSQVPYTSFDIENSIWEESDGALWFLQTFREVYADGDTIIGGKTFQKLREEGITYFYDYPMQTTISDSILFDNYYGAIRENDQKQIEIGFNDTSLILYDFNLAVGDSIEILAPGPGFLPAHVYDMDTVEVCGTLRNRYHIKVIQDSLEYGYTTLTEGVGSSNGIIPEYPLFESGAYLTCFSQVNCTCGEFMTNSKNTLKAKKFSSIFPNPTNHNFNITIHSQNEKATLNIFNNMGQQVLSSEINQSENKINCQNWSDGLYLIIINGNGWQNMHKIMITNDY